MVKPKNHSKAKPAQLFMQDIEHLLDQRQGLYKLSHRIDWAVLEAAFEPLYSDKGRVRLCRRG